MTQTRRQILGTTGVAGMLAAGAAAAAETTAVKPVAAPAIKPDKYANMRAATKVGEAAPEMLKGRVKRPDLVTRQVGVNLAIYDPHLRAVHILSPMAAMVWNHVSPERTGKSVYDMFALAYQDSGVPAQRVVQDVIYALKQFSDAGLIVPEAAAKQVKPSDGAETVITDLDLSIQKGTYERPTLRTVTVDQLKSNHALATSLNAMFADTWIIPKFDL